MKRLLPFLAVLSAIFVSCSVPEFSDNPQEKAAQELACRVLGDKAASHFKFTLRSDSTETCDSFTLRQKGRKVEIVANNANSMAVGLNYYLKYYCNAEYGWLVGDDPVLPERWPDVDEPVTIKARVADRFFLNYCTYGYTMPWWRWSDWEHFIDWMAMNGVNLPLAITGQESIWYQIWTEMGLSDEQVRSYFTGPAHLPWHRMQNIDRWGGPLPKSWLDAQLELQMQITERERELNMKPVLPAFAGHVPRELKEIYPDAPMTELEPWAGYTAEYACTFLDPMSELYTEIQKKFIEKETEIYGTDHVYGLDLFNELMPPSWEPDYLGRVSRQVFESLKAADEDAVWLQMGWLFYNERKYWTNDRVEAYLTSFPADNQLLLDYYCEKMEVWQRTESFYGVPYIWCYLGNFGGNTNLVGQMREIDSRIENTFVNGGSNFRGIGSTLEGFDCNPYVYEYVLEKAWDMPLTKDIPAWTKALANRRTGAADPLAQEAWTELIDSVYVDFSSPGQACYINQRPNIKKSRAYYTNARLKYDNSHLENIIGRLLEVDGRGNAYNFDLTNLTRQMLANKFGELKIQHDTAYMTGDSATMRRLQPQMLEIMKDADKVLATQNYFLLGKWIDDARSWGVDDSEKDYFERNARNLLTSWSDADMLLNDYASRTWNGLTLTYYLPRWEMFFRHINKAMDEGKSWDDAAYSDFNSECTAYERKWWNEFIGTFSASPDGDSKAIVLEIYNKYCK